MEKGRTEEDKINDEAVQRRERRVNKKIFAVVIGKKMNVWKKGNEGIKKRRERERKKKAKARNELSKEKWREKTTEGREKKLITVMTRNKRKRRSIDGR